MSVLLLNASFEPLRIITVRRAIGLIVAGKAEVITEGDGEVRSTTTSFPVPAVVRLQYMVKVPFRATVPLSKRGVLARDAKRCQFTHCTRTASTIDHVVPRSRGGRHEWENVVAACARCNAKKDDRLLSEIGWELRRQPVAPRGVVVMLDRTNPSAVPDAWAEWIPALRG